MPNLLESLTGPTSDAARRAVRVGKQREIRLKLFEPPIKSVVFGVGDLRLGLIVIERL
jgi:hypothetical protein